MFKIFKNYKEYCEYYNKSKQNKFLYFFKQLISFTIIGLLWLSFILWILSLITIILSPFGLLLVLFTNLTFTNYTSFIGIALIYAIFSTTVGILGYAFLTNYVEKKSKMDFNLYVDTIKKWKKQCKFIKNIVDENKNENLIIKDF